MTRIEGSVGSEQDEKTRFSFDYEANNENAEKMMCLLQLFYWPPSLSLQITMLDGEVPKDATLHGVEIVASKDSTLRIFEAEIVMTPVEALKMATGLNQNAHLMFPYGMMNIYEKAKEPIVLSL